MYILLNVKFLKKKNKTKNHTEIILTVLIYVTFIFVSFCLSSISLPEEY